LFKPISTRRSLSMLRVLFLFLILTMATDRCLGDIYLWTDKAGIKHFSNVEPAPSETTRRMIEQKKPAPKVNMEENPGPFFTVVTVYDGDSIKVKNSNLTLMVRLAAIDAPETGHGKLMGQPLGLEAKKMLETLVSGKKIAIKSHGTDMYNRQLAEVFTNGINVNLELLKAGMAEIYSKNTVKGIDLHHYRAAEATAKRAYKGIWGLGARYQSPKIWRKEHPRK